MILKNPMQNYMENQAIISREVAHNCTCETCFQAWNDFLATEAKGDPRFLAMLAGIMREKGGFVGCVEGDRIHLFRNEDENFPRVFFSNRCPEHAPKWKAFSEHLDNFQQFPDRYLEKN